MSLESDPAAWNQDPWQRVKKCSRKERPRLWRDRARLGSNTFGGERLLRGARVVSPPRPPRARVRLPRWTGCGGRVAGTGGSRPHQSAGSPPSVLPWPASSLPPEAAAPSDRLRAGSSGVAKNWAWARGSGAGEVGGQAVVISGMFGGWCPRGLQNVCGAR